MKREHMILLAVVAIALGYFLWRKKMAPMAPPTPVGAGN